MATKPNREGVDASDASNPAFATQRERIALARVLARLAAASTDGREIAGFVAATLQQLAIVLDHDCRSDEASLLRDCAARLESPHAL